MNFVNLFMDLVNVLHVFKCLFGWFILVFERNISDLKKQLDMMSQEERKWVIYLSIIYIYLWMTELEIRSFTEDKTD